MSLLLNNLAAFNRKERFHLMDFAFGIATPEIGLTHDIIKGIKGVLGVSVPPTAWTAMDYHLDWLYAAIHLASLGKNAMDTDGGPFLRDKFQISATQEDIDLLIGFDLPGSDGTRLILIEAKGATAWSQKQFDSKCKRIDRIFQDRGDLQMLVQPYFAMTSPREPQRLVTEMMPVWACFDGLPWKQQGKRYPWFQLPMTGPDGKSGRFLRIQRCDKEGEAIRTGDHWHVVY